MAEDTHDQWREFNDDDPLYREFVTDCVYTGGADPQDIELSPRARYYLEQARRQ